MYASMVEFNLILGDDKTVDFKKERKQKFQKEKPATLIIRIHEQNQNNPRKGCEALTEGVGLPARRKTLLMATTSPSVFKPSFNIRN